MTALRSTDRPAVATTGDRVPRLGLVAAVLGCIAAALTMVLSLVSLVLAPLAVGLGLASVARKERPVPAAVGITAATVSAFLISLEMFVLGW